MHQDTTEGIRQRWSGQTTRTRKERALAVLFFGGLWGLGEATLGNALYSSDTPHASVPLTVIGFVILSIARVYFPRAGMATLIAACAMLYKFLNTPFFACHLLGILMMGIWYDVFFSVLSMKRKWLAAVLATYGNYAAFALMITYVARYEHWVQGGFTKIFGHVGIDGSVAAVACAVLVPLGLALGAKLKAHAPAPFLWRGSMVPRGVAVVTAGLWVLGVAAHLLHHAPHG